MIGAGDSQAALDGVFIVADEPLLVFQSISDAVAYLEPIDVENGVYPVAYGPLGELYRIQTVGGQVIIERVDEPNRPDELRPLLLDYLKNRGAPIALDESIEVLARRVLLDDQAFWAERDPFGDRFGTRIPSWSCLVVLGMMAVVAYLLLR